MPSGEPVLDEFWIGSLIRSHLAAILPSAKVKRMDFKEIIVVEAHDGEVYEITITRKEA